MKVLFATLVFVLFSPVAATAEQIMMTSTGTITEYKSKEPTSGPVSPSTAMIDVDRKTVSILGGAYDITHVAPERIYLSASTSDLIFQGSIDRTTGPSRFGLPRTKRTQNFRTKSPFMSR
jgi:hypothetical protein